MRAPGTMSNPAAARDYTNVADLRRAYKETRARLNGKTAPAATRPDVPSEAVTLRCPRAAWASKDGGTHIASAGGSSG